MLVIERQLASPTRYDNQEEIVLQQDYDHLKLDQCIAVTACENLVENDPLFVELGQALKDAAALATFEAVYPEIVKVAELLFGDIEPTLPMVSSSPLIETENPTDSLEIPAGQPLTPHNETPLEPSW